MSRISMTVAGQSNCPVDPPEGWKFRSGTHDREIWRCVVEEDEYGLQGRRFLPSDLVVDVGAHIGSFSWWAWQHGASNIQAYEAAGANFAVCVDNLLRAACCQGVTLLHGALWGNQAADIESVWFNASTDSENTGGGDILTSGRPTERTRLFHGLPASPVRFLKMDCEGSEFPILFGSNLKGVAEIAGEYHELGPGTFHAEAKPIPDWAKIPGVPSWTRGVLRDYLQDNGFDVQIRHEAENIGKFFARNKQFPESHR